MPLPITLTFGSQWMAPNFVYQSVMTELDFQTGRDEGLGLYLMRHAAGLSGGTFDIRRNGQKGTIVTCRAIQLNRNDFDLIR